MKEEEIESKLAKFNDLIQIMVPDERSRWYLAGLIDGYKIHGKGHRRR